MKRNTRRTIALLAALVLLMSPIMSFYVYAGNTEDSKVPPIQTRMSCPHCANFLYSICMNDNKYSHTGTHYHIIFIPCSIDYYTSRYFVGCLDCGYVYRIEPAGHTCWGYCERLEATNVCPFPSLY